MASSTDPSGLLGGGSGGPSVVKVIGTARDDMNNELGIVVNFNEDRGRYLIHLVKNQNTVALKPENLQKASFLEQFQAQYQQLTKDPRVANEVTRIWNQIQRSVLGANSNISLKQAGIGFAVFFGVLVFLLGFSKTVLLMSFLMITLTVIGPDLASGGDWKTVLRNMPQRFTAVIEQHMPGGQYIAKNKFLLVGLAAFLVYVFVSGIISTPTSANKPLPPLQPPTASIPTTTTTTATRDGTTKMQDYYYKLGFEDASSQKQYGESLTTEIRELYENDDESLRLNVKKMDEFDMYNQDILPPRASAVPPPAKTSKFGFGTAMSLFYVGRTVMDLGKGVDSQWSFDVMKNNLITLEPWKLAMLGFSLFNLVKTFIF